MKRIFASLLASIFVFSAIIGYAGELENAGKRIQEALTIIEEEYYKKLTPEQEKAIIQGLEESLNKIVRDNLDRFSFFRLAPQGKTTLERLGEKFVGIGVGLSAHPEDEIEFLKELETHLKKRQQLPETDPEYETLIQKEGQILIKRYGIVGERGIYITQVFKNGGAHLAGVKRGWSIVAVQNQKGELKKAAGMETKDVLDLIKGTYLEKSSENTNVRIKFRKPDSTEVVLQILRKTVARETVWGEMKTNDIGYVQITAFSPDTAKGFEDIVFELKKQGMKKLVIDVRNNPGGLENAVDGVLDRLVPPGRIMLFHEKRGKKEIAFYSDYSVPVIFEGPIAVLINRNSASSSEILAGVLKDYGLAKIVGEKTFGKGLVQSNWGMESGGEAYITTYEYIFPVSGYRVHGKGVEPHVPATDDRLTLKDEALDMALEVLKHSK
ncbi:MAG: hypothetical protein HYY55_02730 [Candidatus Niyogibacteria bacterium]|nr:MAG: hypothetical protein HYY55_02730 [Candidatus Niyogibacteria bacterium]